MGCCIAEIAMFVFGIITLVKGTFQVSRNRVVTGPPAYLIGAILVGVLPLAVVIGLILGFLFAMRNGGPPNANQLQPFMGIDAAVVLLAFVAVMVIGFTTGKPKQQAPAPRTGPAVNPPYRPADPNNPYAAPQADERDRLLDDMR